MAVLEVIRESVGLSIQLQIHVNNFGILYLNSNNDSIVNAVETAKGPID